MTSPTWSVSSGENFQPFQFIAQPPPTVTSHKKKRRRNRQSSTSSTSSNDYDVTEVDLLGLIKAQLKITNDLEASGTDTSRSNTPMKVKKSAKRNEKSFKQNGLPVVSKRERYASSSYDLNLDAIPELPAHWKKEVDPGFTKINLIA